MTDGDLEWGTKRKTRVSVTTMAIPEIEEVVERLPELPLPLLAPLTLGVNADDAGDHTENERKGPNPSRVEKIHQNERNRTKLLGWHLDF